MAIAAGSALLSTSVGAITGGSLAFGATLSSIGIGTLASHFLVTTALGAAINALNKPSGSTSTASSGYGVTTLGTTLYQQVIYGRTYTGSVRAYDETTGSSNRYLHRVLVFAGHEIEEFESFFIDGCEVSNLEADGNVKAIDNSNNSDLDTDNYDGFVTIKQHLGTSDQAADADLVAASDGKWTTDHRLRGLAYIYVKLKYNSDVFPNGVPEIGAIIKGKKVYDPRTATTGWSDNPALCIRDYLTTPTYGLGEDSDNIDDAVVSAQADVCEGLYTCNGYFTTDVTPYTVLGSMLTSMGGLLWYAQGKWRMKSAYWTEPNLSYAPDDFRSAISVSTRHSRADNFNTVKGTFLGEESSWEQSEFTSVTNQDFIDADGGEEADTDLEFAFTNTSAEARYLSNIYLERNRQQLTVSLTLGMRGFLCQVGDNINLTYERFGWDEKAFEVTSWTFGLSDQNDLVVDVVLREISESVFDALSDGDIYERDNANLLSTFYVPNLGLNVFDEAAILRGVASNALVANVTSSNPTNVSEVEVEYKSSADSEWINMGSGPLGLYKVLNLEVGDYDVRARIVSTFGRTGKWSYLYNNNINAFSDPPSVVDGFKFEVIGSSLDLEWDSTDDLDLDYYAIRHTPLTSGFSWANATTAVEKVSTPTTSTSVPLRSGTYMIKAVDKSGVSSLYVSSVIVPETYLPTYATTLEQAEDSTFSGTTTNTEVVLGALRLDSPRPEDDTGEYQFSTYIDSGTARRVWASMRCVSSRDDTGSGLFDDLDGKTDTFEGLWDELGSLSASGDTTVKFYIRTTDDDPAGSPTWSDWQQFRAANFYGRAFDFKVELFTKAADITPSISELKATVEYD